MRNFRCIGDDKSRMTSRPLASVAAVRSQRLPAFPVSRLHSLKLRGVGRLMLKMCKMWKTWKIRKTWKRDQLVFAALTLVCAAPAFAASPIYSLPFTEPTDSYPLDSVDRRVAARGPLICPEKALVQYRGDGLTYNKPLRIVPAFRERLELFEAVVAETAIEFYGRAPRKLDQLGSFACRRIRTYPEWLSEHAMGNAVDIAGFIFPPATAKQAKAKALPPALRRGFTVTVLQHWQVKRTQEQIHSRFLQTLAARLIERTDIFRVLLGPAYPGHKNHFHFDNGPYRLIEM